MTEVAPRPLSLQRLPSSAGVWVDDTRTRISVTGDDRVTWLNGILSNDVLVLAKTKAPHALYACTLDAKGKLLGDAIVIADPELAGSVSVWLPTRSVAAVLGGWDRFIVMEDVEVTRDDSRRLLMLQGGAAAEVAERAGMKARAAAHDELGAGGFVFDFTAAQAEEAMHRLVSQGAIALEGGDVRTLRVEAGRATFGVDVDEHNNLHEGGLEKRAVSFSKGCYLGQEVVCMLEMRGHPSKRLVQLAIEGTDVTSGDEVKVDGAAGGKVTSVVPRSDGTAIALALVKYSHANPGVKVEVRGHSGAVVGRAT